MDTDYVDRVLKDLSQTAKRIVVFACLAAFAAGFWLAMTCGAVQLYQEHLWAYNVRITCQALIDHGYRSSLEDCMELLR